MWVVFGPAMVFFGLEGFLFVWEGEGVEEGGRQVLAWVSRWVVGWGFGDTVVGRVDGSDGRIVPDAGTSRKTFSPFFQGSKVAEPLPVVLPLLVLIRLSINSVGVWGLVFSYLLCRVLPMYNSRPGHVLFG